MARVAAVYGTTEGRTGVVAERMADVLAETGWEPDATAVVPGGLCRHA